MPEQGSLTEIVRRLVQRNLNRSEATIQSDVRQFLLSAPFQLDEEHLDAPLEVPVGDGRRIDIEIGLTVIEIKRDLRKESVKAEGITQLCGYVKTRSNDLCQRYTGILADGVDWFAYHLVDDEQLGEVSHFELIDSPSIIEDFVVWLEGFLATVQAITPTPREIERRLGATSSAHALDLATIATLYQQNRSRPTVVLKRELWAKLLRTALGTQFTDSDDLFVEHTLLVVSAEIIAHAVVGFNVCDVNPASLVRGALFTHAQIHGVVEADFFDWIIEVPGGDRFVRSMARRLARFSWSRAEHDVMKTLYESIIGTEQRKQLGEYYTPDWLADRVVEHSVTNPAEDRVLDPACGSGTFLFHAIRRHLAALEKVGKSVPEQVESVTRHVFGIDIHPVAVTLARVTYLLAIGDVRLKDQNRPAITVPVFLGDTIQWSTSEDMLAHQMLVVPTTDQRSLIPEELRFPDRLLDDTRQFDGLVADLADKVEERKPGAAVPSLAAIFRRYGIREEDRPILTETFGLMCSLHDQGRDHIWGYYVRNIARPLWLSRPENRVDVLIGNPPWLSYRYMPSEMQRAFKEMCKSRGLWHGATLATNQDLSSLFVARTIQLYLRRGGRFGYVLPEATLSRRQYAGFRTGIFASRTEPVAVKFDRPWSLNQVKPAFFPVPACAVFGTRDDVESRPLESAPEIWAGRLEEVNATWSSAENAIVRRDGELITHDDPHQSPYNERFSQGASIVPRMLFIVERVEEGPLGAGVGRVTVRSARSSQEKSPWKELPGLEGSIEVQFLRSVVVGESVVPFSFRAALLAVIPLDGAHLLHGEDELLDLYPGLAKWWRSAEQIWMENRSSENLTLAERLNFRNGLTEQAACSSGTRVVYSSSGMYLVACRITDPRALVDTKLYWCAVSSEDEGHFLTAILNSPITTERVRPFQSRGEHNPRDFHKHVWKLPIPSFDESNDSHRELVELAIAAEQFVSELDMPSDVRFESVRRFVRDALNSSQIGQDINRLSMAVLDENVGDGTERSYGS